MEQIEERKPRILWWSNAPFVGTGYGVGTKGVCDRIAPHYDLRNLCTYGVEGRALGMDGRVHYPRLFGQYGEDAAELIIKNWAPDIMITLFDIWVGEQPSRVGPIDWFRQLHNRWIAYFPVDHDPLPPGVGNQARQAWKRVAMSRFGQKALEDKGMDSIYIPHGVDTKVFKPDPAKADAVEWLIRQSVPILPEEQRSKSKTWNTSDFIIGINAAPKDPVRKGYPEMFMGFQIFLEQNPDARSDARLYLHALKRYPGGWNLDHLAQIIQPIEEYIRVTHPYHLYCSLNDQSMAKMYAAFDVLMNCSRGEGFGIPILEAAACGVPTIATDYTSMTELVEGHGWLVPTVYRDFTVLLSLWGVPNPFEIADALEKAYNSNETLIDFAKKGREFSLGFDWDDHVGPAWIDLLDQSWDSIRERPLQDRRMML